MAQKSQTRANGNQTKQRILDAAEQLFGESGFDLVSLRDITDAADVTLALASYHFGAKYNLFESVVARRAKVLCEVREARLAELDADASSRDLLQAFIAPLFEYVQSKDAGWKSYTLVLSRLAEADRWLDLLEAHFDQTALLFQNRLVALFPKADPNLVARGFTMIIQLMLATAARHRRLELLTKNAASVEDLDAAFAALLDFSDAGLQSLNKA